MKGIERFEKRGYVSEGKNKKGGVVLSVCKAQEVIKLELRKKESFSYIEDRKNKRVLVYFVKKKGLFWCLWNMKEKHEIFEGEREVCEQIMKDLIIETILYGKESNLDKVLKGKAEVLAGGLKDNCGI